MKFDRTEEGLAAYHLTTSMYSIGFLDDITQIILNEKKNGVPVIEFYKFWLNHRDVPDLLPITTGITLGYLYVGILYSKEIWFDLIPDVPIEKSGNEWCLNTYTPTCSKTKNPTLKYVIRRIRNSLGHGYAKTIFPENLTNREALNNMNIEFFDQNPHDPEDTFTLVVKVFDIKGFIVQFQNEIYNSVIKKPLK